MKKMSSIKILAAIFIVAISVVSCTNEKVDQPTTSNEVANNDLKNATSNQANLTMFNESLSITGLKLEESTETNKSNNSGFTFFAPTNQAFATFLAANGFSNLSQVPQALLRDILNNHLVKGKKLAADLQTGYLKTFSTAGSATRQSPLSLYVDKTTGVKLNGVSNVVTPNITFGFVVVHIVDKVIPLPTIVTHATANASFTSLVGALTSPGQPNFVSVLSGTGPFTVFAPTNGAFTSLNTELAPGGIASVSAANLTKVLQYHVVGNANVLASSLTNNQIVTPILTPSQTFKIQLPSTGPQIKDASNRISKIIATDVQCTNGVVHVLDKVLLPVL
jgi:uncharacterized surface protein with fasciclin (FAS1) repeats